MPYITNNQLSAAVASAIGLGSGASLPFNYINLIPSANSFAYLRLRNALFDRGYTPAQVDAWDENQVWNQQLGVCIAFWNASKGDEDRGEPFRREYEQLMKDLVATRITIANQIVDPAGQPTRIGAGSFDHELHVPSTGELRHGL